MVSILLFISSQLYCYYRALFSSPSFLFVGYVIIYFMYHEGRWWYYNLPTLSYSFYNSVTILLAAIFLKSGTKTKIFSIPPLKWGALLLGYYTLVQFWALLPTVHSVSLSNFAKLLVVLAAAFKLCKTSKDFENYLLSFVAGAAYIGYYMLEVGRDASGRVEGVGTVDSPEVNGMAAILAPAAILCLHYFWQSKTWQYRAFSIIAGALIMNGLVLMNSRGAFIAVILGAGWYMYAIYKSKGIIKYKNAKLFAVVILGLASLTVVVDEQAINRILTLKEESSLSAEQETGSTRVFFWLASLDMTNDYPLGAGAGSFVVYSPFYIPENIDTGKSRNRAIHSTWFQALNEVGYPGAILFFAVLISCINLMRKMKKHAHQTKNSSLFFVSTALQSCLFSYIIAATFLDRFRAVALYILILFVCVGYNVYFAQKVENEKM